MNFAEGRINFEQSSLVAPLTEFVINAVPIAEVSGQIAPTRSAFQYPQNSVESGARIKRRASYFLLLREQTFYSVPLFLCYVIQ